MSKQEKCKNDQKSKSRSKDNKKQKQIHGLLQSDEYVQESWVDRILKEHPGLTAEDILKEAKGAGFL